MFLGNHCHEIVVPNGDPSELAAFMNFVDGEVAKLVKRYLGKLHNVKIWAQRYNAIRLLDFDDVIDELVYSYSNPVSANLVAKASKWFGLTTVNESFESHSAKYKFIRSSQIERLPNANFTKKSLRKLVDSLEQIEGPVHTLRIEPLALVDCFRSANDISKEAIIKRILDGVADSEAEEARKRKREGRSVAEREVVEFQNPHKKYLPKKYGNRVFCISRCSILRAQFIELYKSFCAKCAVAWEEWKRGNISFVLPPGAFRPPCRPNANIILAPS